MVKSCLLISGLPRNVEKGFEEINRALIQPNNPDIFIHTWIEPGTRSVDEACILNKFQPKKLIMEKQRIFTNSHIKVDRMMARHGGGYPSREKFVEMLHSSWYSLQQAHLLKEQYRLENDIFYDYVIRARFDITYSHPVNCKNYASDMIVICNRPGLPPEMIDDRFAFGSDALMGTYCNMFGLINYVQDIRDKGDGIICGETLVYETSKLFNIKYYQIDSLGCGFLR